MIIIISTLQFDHTTDVLKFDGFKVLNSVDHEENPIQLYKYPEQENLGVVTNGLTFANHIPVFNMNNTNIQVQIVITVNEVDNPPSEAFTTEECTNTPPAPPAPPTPGKYSVYTYINEHNYSKHYG